MQNVTTLPPSDNMSPMQALLSALDLAKAGQLKEVMIVGFDENEDLIIRASKTTNRDALWAAEVLRKYAMGDYDED